jgi:hypothetical protein
MAAAPQNSPTATLPERPATDSPSIVPVSASIPVFGISPTRRLALRAIERDSEIPAFIARLRRRELSSGKPKPMEVMLFKYRRDPHSIHLKWLGDAGKGRELVYVLGKYDSKLHFRTGVNDLFAGRRMALPVDSSLVRANSRIPITEIGLTMMVRRFATAVDQVERGLPNAGIMRYIGEVARAEFLRPLEIVEHDVPAGQDELMPKGGTRLFGFDDTGMPVLVISWDENRNEVEYYCCDRFQGPISLDENDFDPDVILGR